MIIPIIYPSAAEFWLDATNRKNLDRFALNVRQSVSLPEDYSFEFDANSCLALMKMTSLSAPLYIIDPTPGKRRSGKYFVCRCRHKNLPDNSFIKVGSIHYSHLFTNAEQSADEIIEIYVESPEMCFLEAALQLPFNELILLGYELCARYVVDKNKEYLQRTRSPLTTRQTISSFLNKIEFYRGIKPARRAIKYVIDNSNSPIESRLAMIASLPFSMGGYALRKPELNAPVGLSEDASKLAGRSSLLGDLVWSLEKVVTEYDSNASRLSPDQHSYDKKRILAFELSGYKVLNITSGDLKNIEAADEVFGVLRAMLGLRKSKSELKKYYWTRMNLFSNLFTWI